MEVEQAVREMKKAGIRNFTGVPDSTLKPFCDYLNSGMDSGLKHYVTADEGGALALAIGTFLGGGGVSCVYMQNSGIGNIVNPFTSLASKDIYEIPVLFLIGWRGEPGEKDEPQHKFMGEITESLLSVLGIGSVIADRNTTEEMWKKMLADAGKQFAQNRPYAILIKKGTFDSVQYGKYENNYSLNREEAIRMILKGAGQEETVIVSTTGKISREVYEQSDSLYGNHDHTFLTVGGMGYASMIACGIAQSQPDKKVYCLDGDGAALMHMGNLVFLGREKISGYIHICLNNHAHESVGGMPTPCGKMSFSTVAQECGYQYAAEVRTKAELACELEKLKERRGPVFLEVKVSLESRENLGRPKESPVENKKRFMKKITG